MDATDQSAATEIEQAPEAEAPATGGATTPASELAGQESPGEASGGDRSGESASEDEDGGGVPSSEDGAEAVDSAALAREMLDQILQAMAVPATVGVQRQNDGAIRLLVEGPEMGVVIGKHGGTINALQYLVGLIVQKRSGERNRLVIDAEGYRSRREQALKEMALTYARRVKETGNEAVLDALQSYERRIIHNSLADDPDVFTYSEGEEPDRRVVISPREAADDAME